MKIEIKKENYKELLQCIYLGNLIFDAVKDEKLKQKNYDFLKSVLMQIVKAMPKTETVFNLKFFPYQKSDDFLLSDLIDRIEDSVEDYYEEYRLSLFCEMCAEKIAPY